MSVYNMRIYKFNTQDMDQKLSIFEGWVQIHALQGESHNLWVESDEIKFDLKIAS